MDRLPYDIVAQCSYSHKYFKNETVRKWPDFKRKADAARSRSRLLRMVQIIYHCEKQIKPLRDHEDAGCMSEEMGDGNFYTGFDLGYSLGQSYDELYIYMICFME